MHYLDGRIRPRPIEISRGSSSEFERDEEWVQARIKELCDEARAGKNVNTKAGRKKQGKKVDHPYVKSVNPAGSSRTKTPGECSKQEKRLKILMEYFKIVLDLFFASWFVVGNIWIFGGHSSAEEAPNLYRLCVVFLTFSFIGYALPFILCLTICCCLPCIISTLGVNEDMAQTRGATSERINALPTRKFKLKKSKSIDESNLAVIEGGIVSGGTEKERVISGEDAVSTS